MNEQHKVQQHQRGPFERLRATFVLVAFLLLYWVLSGGLLWWSYDITPLIRGGYYQVNRALSLVAQMGLILTVLTTIVWLLVRRRERRSRPAWRLIWKVAWRTWVFVLAYGGAVLGRLQFGRDKVPLDDSAFLPVLGHVNSHFFSETGWLIFFLYVMPVMGCVSGVLYYLQTLAANTSCPLSD